MNELSRLTDELRGRYGEFFSMSPQVQFNILDVPPNLQALIPYAAFWGLPDDWERERLASMAPNSIKIELKTIIAKYDDLLDDWLAGNEATSACPSNAYVAFSAMRMCADFM